MTDATSSTFLVGHGKRSMRSRTTSLMRLGTLDASGAAAAVQSAGAARSSSARWVEIVEHLAEVERVATNAPGN